MPEANSAPILSKLVSHPPWVKPGVARKPKLTARLREALCFHPLFAAHLLEVIADIRTPQKPSDHSDVKTTMVYTHVFINESIIDQTYFTKISPDPSFPNPAKRGTPFIKGRAGGI